MKTYLRALAVLSAFAMVALLAASAALADSVSQPQSELADTSHQVADIQHKIADLMARGQTARAGKLAAIANCGNGIASPVFAPWGDLSSYWLAPGGDLLDASQWTFKHATVGSDASPLGGNSLSLSQGDSDAVSPVICVNLDSPTIRFFMKDVGGNGKANVKLDVLYEDLNGNVRHLTLAKLRTGSSWSPTLPIPIAVNLLSTASSRGITAVAFEFKVEGLQKNEVLKIASLYVDPFVSR